MFVYIPPIRLKDDKSIVRLIVYVNEETVVYKTLDTKRGEFIVATKQIELKLNDLLKDCNEINLRVQIEENDLPVLTLKGAKPHR